MTCYVQYMLFTRLLTTTTIDSAFGQLNGFQLAWQASEWVSEREKEKSYACDKLLFFLVLVLPFCNVSKEMKSNTFFTYSIVCTSSLRSNSLLHCSLFFYAHSLLRRRRLLCCTMRYHVKHFNLPRKWSHFVPHQFFSFVSFFLIKQH